MAERTFYDILEVSHTASSDTISAAYERLAAKLNPAQEANAGNAAVRLQYDAIRQAYLTLSDADKRTQYDRKLALRDFTSMRPVEVLDSFWTVPKMLIAGIIVLGLAGFYFKHQKDKARLEAEKVIAVAKAREAETKAIADAETERLALLRERERERADRYEAARLRNERESDVSRFQREYRVNEYGNRGQAQSEEAMKRAEAMRIKREEAQAAAAARQQLARDKAELCRMEYERYGKTISC